MLWRTSATSSWHDLEWLYRSLLPNFLLYLPVECFEETYDRIISWPNHVITYSRSGLLEDLAPLRTVALYRRKKVEPLRHSLPAMTSFEAPSASDGNMCEEQNVLKPRQSATFTNRDARQNPKSCNFQTLSTRNPSWTSKTNNGDT